jgi:hypothetical protein
MFVVYSLLSKKEAQYAYDGIRQWFKDNPDRDTCQTESFSVRRDHIKEDILASSVKGTVLEDSPKNKNFKASLPPKKTKPKAKPKAKKLVKKVAKKAAKKVK